MAQVDHVDRAKQEAKILCKIITELLFDMKLVHFQHDCAKLDCEAANPLTSTVSTSYEDSAACYKC
jgi:hypothetical protein